MKPLTPEEEAELRELEADDDAKVPVDPKPGTTRPERFSDFAPGILEDGTKVVVEPAKK